MNSTNSIVTPHKEPIEYKKCPECSETKPLTAEFWYRDKPKKSGYQTYCKPCSIIRQKTRRNTPEHRAHRRGYDRIYRQRTDVKSRLKAIRRGSYQKEYQKEYRKKYGGKYQKEYWKKYKQSPVGIATRMNARVRHGYGITQEITTDEIERLLELYPHCLRCKTTENLCFDHIIPLSRGGENTFDNLQRLCVYCNASKFIADTDYRPKGGSDVR